MYIIDYFKALGGQNCPTNQIVASRQECEVAGSQLGYPFAKEVTSVDNPSNPGENRPAGCFWDQNGHSYFNTNMDASASWNGVGGICKRKGISSTF